MAPLGPNHVAELLGACADYAREHRELLAIVDELRVTFPPVRDAFDKMARLTSSARDLRMCGLIISQLQQTVPPLRAALNRLARLAAHGQAPVAP